MVRDSSSDFKYMFLFDATKDEQTRRPSLLAFVILECRGGVVRGAGGGMGGAKSCFGSEGLSHERN